MGRVVDHTDAEVVLGNAQLQRAHTFFGDDAADDQIKQIAQHRNQGAKIHRQVQRCGNGGRITRLQRDLPVAQEFHRPGQVGRDRQASHVGIRHIGDSLPTGDQSGEQPQVRCIQPGIQAGDEDRIVDFLTGVRVNLVHHKPAQRLRGLVVIGPKTQHQCSRFQR